MNWTRLITVFVGFIVFCILFGLVMVTIGDHVQHWTAILHAQDKPKIWELASFGTATRLYKIQDGSCSIYVVVASGSTDTPVSVATGQGCR